MQSLTIEFVALPNHHHAHMHPPVKLRVLTQRHIAVIQCLQESLINENIKAEEAGMTGRRGNATLIPIYSKQIRNSIRQDDLRDTN